LQKALNKLGLLESTNLELRNDQRELNDVLHELKNQRSHLESEVMRLQGVLVAKTEEMVSAMDATRLQRESSADIEAQITELQAKRQVASQVCIDWFPS
jgi:uncharacterized coiled-coil DUF342 family protein